MSNPGLLVVVLVSAAAWLACGDDDGAAGGDSGPGGDGPIAEVGACDLLDLDAVEDFTGESATIAYMDDESCRVDSGGASISIALFPDSSRSDYDNARSAHTGAEDVPGLGDAAHHAASLNTIQFLEGDLIVSTQILGSDAGDEAIYDALLELATIAHGRL